MEVNIIIIMNLVFYSIIVSQSYSYLISLSDVQKNMDAGEYISFRQKTDKNYRRKFAPVIYGTLASNILLIMVSGSHPTGLLFITALLAFIALVGDILFTLKGNMPINNLINTWTADKYPDNWETYREDWLQVFRKRQALNITGFILLLVGAILQ